MYVCLVKVWVVVLAYTNKNSSQHPNFKQVCQVFKFPEIHSVHKYTFAVKYTNCLLKIFYYNNY